MRLNRKSSLLLAFVTIALFFAIAHFTAPTSSVSTVRPKPTPTEINGNGTSTEPEEASQFELTHFQRSETRNGRKVWEVTADNGKYFPKLEMTRLKNVKLISTKSEDSTFTVSAVSADVRLKGTSLSTAELNTDVVATIKDEVTVETESATYDYEKGLVTAPGFVKITGPFYTSQGDSMVVETEEEIITLEGNVRTQIDPVPRKEGDKK